MDPLKIEARSRGLVKDVHVLPRRACVILAYAPWCSHCHNFSQVFLDVAKTSRATFVAVNADSKEGRAALAAIGVAVDMFPTTVFLAPDGTHTQRVGGMTAEALRARAAALPRSRTTALLN